MAVAEGFSWAGNETTVTADFGGGATGLATAISLHWTGLKSVCFDGHRSDGTGLTMRPNAWKTSEAPDIADNPRPNHHLLEGPNVPKADLEEKLAKRHEIGNLHTKTAFELRIHLGGGQWLGVGFTVHANIVHLLAAVACKDGGLKDVDPTYHKTVWPNLSRSTTDLPDLSLNLCRSRSDQSAQDPRWQIRGYSHRFDRGFTDRVVQKGDRPNKRHDMGSCSSDRAKYCRYGVDLSDLSRSRQKIGGNPSELEIKSVKLDFTKEDSADLKQIFIRSIEGRHVCMQIWERMSVLEVKKETQDKLGIPAPLQNLLFSGLCLQDQHTLQHYRVAKDSTIILNLRLRGGSKGASSKPTGTYRDAAKGKEPPKGKEPSAANEPPGQYIMDQSPESPSISLDLPEVNFIFSDLQKNVVICRFNGFCPRTDALYPWIHTVWTKNCQIQLCSKGFFIVTFLLEEEKEKILNQGPWF